VINFDQFGRGKRKLIGLHGWFGDETTFKPLELSLDPNEFHCAWLAQRGYGTSADVTGDYTMAEMANDALAVADHLGWTDFNVIGHSMGGKAAQLVAAKVPDRVGKLVAVTPVGAGAVPFDGASRALFVGATEDASNRHGIIDLSTGNRLSPVWLNKLVASSFARSRREAFGAYFRSWADDDLVALVKGCMVDALVLVGAEDLSITLQAAEMGFRGVLPNLRIEVLANSGHYPMDEVPLAVGAMVGRFLTS
jgi:esterase